MPYTCTLEFDTFLCHSQLDNEVKIKFEVMWRTRAPDDEFSIFSLKNHTILNKLFLECVITLSKPSELQ